MERTKELRIELTDAEVSDLKEAAGIENLSTADAAREALAYWCDMIKKENS